MNKFTFQYGVDGLRPEQFQKLRRDWVHPPAPAVTLSSLRNMNAVVLAIDEKDEVVGFICGMTDQLLILYVWDCEVIASHRDQGVEQELLRRMLSRYGQLYQVNAHPGKDHREVFREEGFSAYSQDDALAMTRMDMMLQDGGTKAQA